MMALSKLKKEVVKCLIAKNYNRKDFEISNKSLVMIQKFLDSKFNKELENILITCMKVITDSNLNNKYRQNYKVTGKNGEVYTGKRDTYKKRITDKILIQVLSDLKT